MKIIKDLNNKVLYKFNDSVELIYKNKYIEVVNHFNILDLNTSNSILVTGVANVPEDFIGHKYFYDGTWTLNPNFTPPADEEIETLQTRVEELETELAVKDAELDAKTTELNTLKAKEDDTLAVK